MKPKRGGTKGVKLPRRRAHTNAYADLPQKPTPEQLKDAAINVSLADLEDRVADVRDSWETDSLFEDALDNLSEETSSTSTSEFLSRLGCGHHQMPNPNSVVYESFSIRFNLPFWKLFLASSHCLTIPMSDYSTMAHSFS
jgi:hypothetical protein